MSFPASTSAVRLSGHRTAKIATAVINANANHRVMELYDPLAEPMRGRHRRAYITPDHGGNGTISHARSGQMHAQARAALLSPALATSAALPRSAAYS